MFENHCIYDKETICAVEDKNPATCSERGCVAQKIYISGYMTCMNELVGQRRFGTWRKVCEVPSGQLYRCSRCGRDIVTTLTDKEAILQEYPYCHCGTKMVGKSDS